MLNALFRRFPPMFWQAGSFVALLFIGGIFFPARFTTVTDQLNDLIYRIFGSFYLWFAMLTLVAFIAIGLSPLGHIRLGGSDARPQFSRASWFAMLFCAGMGTGLMFWGAAEPLYHFMNPPLTTATSQSERIVLAFHYSFFHWGIHPWAIYGMSALAIGFFGFNMNQGFNFSAFLFPTHAKTRIQTLGKDMVDLLTVLAIIFGIAATFGMGILQLEGGLKGLFGMETTPWITVGLIAIMTACYLLSTLKGLSKGIQVLSDYSFLIYLIILGWILWLAPHFGFVSPIFQSIPDFITRLPAMSLGIGSYQSPHWVGDWTVKYWSWWIAWAPFCGLFFAFISRGRTVRELVCATMIFPTLFSGLWFIIFGQAAIAEQLATGYAGQMLDLNHVNSILFSLLKTLTHQPWLPMLCLVMIALDFINSADGATYTLSRFCLRSFDTDEHPPRLLQYAWGLVFAGMAALFLLTGGIHILQQVTLITALPFTLLLVVVFARLIVAMIRYRLCGDSSLTRPDKDLSVETTLAGC